MSKAKTLFDHLEAITKHQDPEYWNGLTEEDQKTWSNFMISRFMSMNSEWTEIVDRLQYVTQAMHPRDMYKLYIDIFPSSDVFLKYVSGVKKIPYEEWLVDLVKRHYECSKENAVDYLNILFSFDEGRETILYLCEIYAVDKKKVRSLKLN